MLLGEVSPGGVGAGLYGMLIFALLAVFIAGLMVGRTPEYLGKKIEATEMKLVVALHPRRAARRSSASPRSSVVLAGSRLVDPQPRPARPLRDRSTPSPRRRNNNGSAFAGLTGNTAWYNTTLGLAMLIGRFFLIIPVLAIAGSLARKQPVPATAGTFPTDTPLFAGLLVGVILIVVGLTFFPALALGPIVEQL